MHDWISKAGQQIGGEYRYILAPGSQGNSTVSFLERARAMSRERRHDTVVPGRQSYNVVGGLMQRLPLNLRLRANANYFSSIVTQQHYQQDVYRATSSRRIGRECQRQLGRHTR